jgi:hypothetical protein
MVQTISNHHVPKIYYFVAMDCNNELHSRHKTLPRIEVEMEITHVKESENGDKEVS